VTWLLDGNVLSALAIDSHEHHARAANWWAGIGTFATCAITQGTLLRVHMIMAVDQSAAAAWGTLKGIEELPGHEFWDEGFSYSCVSHQRLHGPKQVTDAWLVELARRRKSRLATFDGPLAALHKETVLWIPL
jgi:toxin-antitoxin system PIN domain toxin